jgi:hypothetical protein
MLKCNANAEHEAPVLIQRGSDGLFVCAPCVDNETWGDYPGAQEREIRAYNTAQKRAERARQQFGKEAENKCQR